MRYLKTYENADKTNDYQVGDMIILTNPDIEDRGLGFKKDGICRIRRKIEVFSSYPYEIINADNDRTTQVSASQIRMATSLDLDQIKYNL